MIGVFLAQTAERAKRTPGNPLAGNRLGNGTTGLDHPKGGFPRFGGGGGFEGGRRNPVETAREELKAHTSHRQATQPKALQTREKEGAYGLCRGRGQ